MYAMEEILESIRNGQRKQAIQQIQESRYLLEDVFEELEKDEIIRLYRVALSMGYLEIN